MDPFEKELYGSLFGEAFNESGDDDFDDLEEPDFGEESESDVDVDNMLDTITSGEADTLGENDGETDDLAELEREFHLTQAGGGEDLNDTPDTSAEMDDELDAIDRETNADDDIEEALPVGEKADGIGNIVLQKSITPELVESCLDETEYEEFLESGDAHVASSEGMLPTEYVMEALEEELGTDNIFEEGAKFAPEGKKWKMTKKARLAQLFETSLQIEARLHNDPDYQRMQKIYKIRRTIRQKWRKRYGSLAMRRAKRYLKGLMTSKSNGLVKVAQRLVGKK